MQDLRRGRQQHQVDVPVDGQGGGAQQVNGAGLQTGRSSEGSETIIRNA